MASQGDIRAYELQMESGYSGAPYAGAWRDVEASLFDDLESYGVTPFNPESPAPVSQQGLSYFDQFLGWITPESHAESVVNQIYSTPGNTIQKDPYYSVEDFSSPNVYVKAKGAVTSAAQSVSSAVSGTFSAFTGIAKYAGIAVVIVLLLVVATYAGVSAFARR